MLHISLYIVGAHLRRSKEIIGPPPSRAASGVSLFVAWACREIGPIVDEEAGIEAGRVHAMTVGRDGTLYAGETGATQSRFKAGTGDIEAGVHPYLYVIET